MNIPLKPFTPAFQHLADELRSRRPESFEDPANDADHTEWEVERRIDRLKGLGEVGIASLVRLQRKIQDAILEDREDLVG